MMTPPKSTEILDAQAQLLTCLDRLAEVLAFALALERDPILRAAAAAESVNESETAGS